jgi:hypothetical protein
VRHDRAAAQLLQVAVAVDAPDAAAAASAAALSSLPVGPRLITFAARSALPFSPKRLWEHLQRHITNASTGVNKQMTDSSVGKASAQQLMQRKKEFYENNRSCAMPLPLQLVAPPIGRADYIAPTHAVVLLPSSASAAFVAAAAAAPSSSSSFSSSSSSPSYSSSSSSSPAAAAAAADPSVALGSMVA